MDEQVYQRLLAREPEPIREQLLAQRARWEAKAGRGLAPTR